MQESTTERKRQIIEFCIGREQIIGKAALEALQREEHWREVLADFKEPIISAEKVREKLARHESKLENVVQEVVVRKSLLTGLAKDSDSDFRIMKELDITGQTTSRGKVGDFLTYFRDKYEFLSGLLHHRQGFSPKSLERLKSSQKYAEFDIVGMVVKRWVSKAGNITLELDNPEGRFVAIVSKDDAALTREAEKILVDDVIGIKGKKYTDEMLIVKLIIWPDLPQRPPRHGNRGLSACLISDVHVGSRLFMEKEFMKFLSWLNGTSISGKDSERAGRIKYLFIAGDNVDGVGVYPEQYEELAIKDIYRQYERFGELIAQVPEHIEIFICTPQGTLIKTPKGYKPVEEVKEGEEVFSYDEKKNKVTLNRIDKVMSRFAPKLIKLTFSGGLELVSTPEHPLFVYENGNFAWKNTAELCKGELLPVPMGFNEKLQLNTLELLKKIDEEIYVKKPQTALIACSQNNSLSQIPERTRFSYFAAEAPVPLSLLVNTGDAKEDLFDWPIQVKTHHGKYVKLQKKIPTEFLYFIGILLTDGSFRKIKNKFPDGRLGYSYQIRIYNSNKEIIQSVKNCLKEFDILPTGEYVELPKKRGIGGAEAFFKKPIINLSYTNKFLGELLISLGITPGIKKKSTFGSLSNLTWEYTRQLLAGIFDGDGTRGKKLLQLGTSSKRFATEMFLLLQEHGFSPNLSSLEKFHHVTVHRNMDIKRLFKELPLKRISKNIPEMNENISKGILNSSYERVSDSQKEFLHFRKLVKKEEIAGDIVYNVEVEKTHTYIAMGFINHNCPGQHDAVRRADPQPAISNEYVKGLSGMGNIHFVGSPSWVEMEGLKTLIYHGGSFHDMYAATKHLSVKEPEKAMVDLLRKRDLSTGFGLNQPYVPEGKDFMVIREEPDFYFAGDMHHKGYAEYRGCMAVNSGCWQGRTEFQVREGHVPTPGIAIDINLKTRKLTENNFAAEKEA